jgi:hypothetical protein
MEFLQATTEQKERLQGVYKNASEIQFFPHSQGFWVTPLSNLENPDFAEIMDDLTNLPTVDYELPETQR